MRLVNIVVKQSSGLTSDITTCKNVGGLIHMAYYDKFRQRFYVQKVNLFCKPRTMKLNSAVGMLAHDRLRLFDNSYGEIMV